MASIAGALSAATGVVACHGGVGSSSFGSGRRADLIVVKLIVRAVDNSANPT